MAKMYPRIEPALTRIHRGSQHIFFTASASRRFADQSVTERIGLALRVLGPNEVAYLDQTGSGNETAAHMRADGRLTIMFCAFEGAPMILRLYGRGQTFPRGDEQYKALLAGAFGGEEPPGARQIVMLTVDLAQTSCGYSVPLLDYKDERQTLKNWAFRKGDDGIRKYWAETNVKSIDGLPTGMREALDQAVG